jgi:hypothetical protein
MVSRLRRQGQRRHGTLQRAKGPMKDRHAQPLVGTLSHLRGTWLGNPAVRSLLSATAAARPVGRRTLGDYSRIRATFRVDGHTK